MGRWMTMCLITGHYQSTPDTVVMKDYKEIREAGIESYLRQIEELRLGEEFFASVLPEKFTSTTARTAPYLAYLAAQTAPFTAGRIRWADFTPLKRKHTRFCRRLIWKNVVSRPERPMDRWRI